MTERKRDNPQATPGEAGASRLGEAGDAGARKNGGTTYTLLDIANDYIGRVWNPIPIPYRKKFPTDDDWPKLQITAANVAQYFDGNPQNIGVQLGPKSNGLTDIDLDCPEAIGLASYFLPRTDSTFGRASKPISHLLYTIADAPDQATLKLSDPNKNKDGKSNCIIELRMGGGSKGAQTVFPGSVHESGEPIEWATDGRVVESTYAILKTAVTKIAAATLLIRYFPAKGRRHDAALALGGFLARAGWGVNDIGDFVEIVRRVAGIGNAAGEDPTNLKRAAVDAAETYARGEKNTYGLPGLIKFFGDATSKAVAEFLDYKTETSHALILELAIKLWGEPTHKGKLECQFGEDSNKKLLNLSRGDWFDFENNVGGGARDLMKAVSSAQEEDPNSPAAKMHWDGEVNPVTNEKWLIEELLPEVGSGLISGQTQTYKTFVALDLAAAIMNGEPFLNYPTRREGGVLFIAAEGSSSVALRLKAVTETKYENGKMPFAWKTISPRLLNPYAVDELAKFAAEANAEMQAKFNVPLVLIVIDTIAVAAGYEKLGEENDSTTTQRVMTTLANLATRTTTFVFGVDHYGKNVETGTRGSSAKEGAADVTLALLGEKSATGTVSNPKLLLKKRRDGEVGIVFPFRPRVVEMGVNQFGRTVTSLVIDWGHGTAAPRSASDTWRSSKVLEKIEEAFEKALSRSGFDFNPLGVETVRVIKVAALREAFTTVYIPRSDDDPMKRRKATETAFRRGYDAATAKRLLLVQETEEHGLVVWQPPF
jgi:hypothetical protein